MKWLKIYTESSCMTLMYATLIDLSKKWRGVRMTVSIFQELEKIWKDTMPEAAKNRLKFGEKTTLKEELQLVRV